VTTAAHERRDLHNISIDIAAALDGLCGFTHIPSGRVCRMPHRHSGPCELSGGPAGPSRRRISRQRPLAGPPCRPRVDPSQSTDRNPKDP
jgi:hypothetical protein